MKNNLSQIILDYSEQTPEKIAIYFCKANHSDVPLSYANIVISATEWTASLKNAGVKQGEVVLLILEHSLELIHAYWGSILFGAIPSVIPFQSEKLLPEQYRKELNALVSTTKAAAIITSEKFKSLTERAVGRDSTVRKILTAQDLTSAEQDSPPIFPGLERDAKEIALLQHSSGTTGLQKGVALSHQAIRQQLEDYSQALQTSSQDVVVSWLPLYHDMGLIAGYLLPILLGIPLVLLSPFEWVRAPVLLHKKISEYQGTLSWIPNFAFDFCAQKIRQADLEALDLSSWRALINCSEVVHWQSHKKFVDRFSEFGFRAGAIHTSYAMAENVFAVTQSEIDEGPMEDEIDEQLFRTEKIAVAPRPGHKSTIKVSSGIALPNNQVRIIDDNGEQLADRKVGNVLIKSKSMLNEYYNRPSETKNAFQDGWYKTGDLGYIVGGEVFITGRKKELIIVGGKNIFPQDIERVVYEVEGVKPGRALALGLYNENKGTEDVVVIAEASYENEEQKKRIEMDIRAQVTQKSAIALRHIYLVEPRWLVKTSSGKISRYANQEKLVNELMPK